MSHVAVLKGGPSGEREISLASGAAIETALTELGHQVSAIDVGDDLIEKLREIRPDIAFNALHGTFGEDGTIQGVLEFLKIPYTHSGVMASAVGMDKILTKKIAQEHGIACAQTKKVTHEMLHSGSPILPTPYVIKPISEGSSLGVSIVEEGGSPDLELLLKYKELMAEPYIQGKEISVAVIDEKPLGVIELRPKAGFYDYKNKYTNDMTDHIMPAELPPTIAINAMKWAHELHHALGCKAVSRSDFRYNEENDQLIFLEINTHPGMTPLSLVPEIAAHQDMDFNALIAYILSKASC